MRSVGVGHFPLYSLNVIVWIITWLRFLMDGFTRGKLIILMREEISIMVMTRMYIKRQFLFKWKRDIAPKVIKKLEENKRLSFRWGLHFNHSINYEISKKDDKNDRHVVNLAKWTCIYRE